MPYKLRKAPNRDLYWVVNKETGKKHSNEPLPLERAKAQMRALYANEPKTGGQIPTFNEYLASRGFNKAPSPTTEVAPGHFVANTSPTDRMVFDKKRYDELMALAPSKTKWEANSRRRNFTPHQSYEDYMKSYEKIQRQRSTINATQQGRVNASMSNLGDQNKLYADYIAEYPDQQEVMCDFNETGNRVKTRTTKSQCRQNHATGMEKWERENHPANYHFFRPAVNALAKTTSFLADVVPTPPIVSDIAKGIVPYALEANSYNPVMKGGVVMKDRPVPYSRPAPVNREGMIPEGMKLSAERGAGAKNLNMFELFKGTGSIGKVAKRLGFNVISLDFDPIYTPDIETDVLKWDYRKWAEENNFIPDYIWASPPCNTFSTLAYRLKERNTKTAVPKSARAKEGTAILHKTIEIIKYFQKKNPKLLYTIENPRGMMRHDSEIKKLPNRETTLYCLYGDFKRKPTDFWSNFPMGLKPHTDKCKGKNVVANLANLPTIEQRYSIPARLVKTILSKAKEDYGTEPLMGAGFFGDLWNAAKSVGQKVVNVVSNVVSGRAIRNDYPPYVRGLLHEMGNRPIVEMYVRREPIQSLLNTALNFISRGKWNEVKAKYAYDKLFHLGLEVLVKVSDQDDIYKRFVIEKNEVIEISTAKAFAKDTEVMPVQMGGVGHTMNTLLNGAKQIMGAKFFPYDPFHNNCQDFVMALLTGSGLGNQSVYSFVKQPIEALVSELPSITGKIAKGITDLGGVVNTAIYGQGGLNPSRELASQFKKWGVNPTDYLAEAKKRAKEAGLAENLLGFSSDAKHKLQIPNPDGRVIRFGATGLGDYILYTLSKNPKAEEHRKHYLQRATKIKGDWAKDPYSPNSLAINVLW
jgi:site-specific DNA-cytosine methylase